MLQWGHDEGVVEDDRRRRRSPALETSFNGATTKESWKTEWRSAGSIVDRAGFNGATTKESWKTRMTERCRHEYWSFNGATTKESWKTTADVRRLSARFACFNGATTKVVVEDSSAADRCKGSPSWLQWGHDEGVVEDATRRCVIDRYRISASMGPRRRSRGKRRPRRADVTTARRASMGPRRRSRGRRSRRRPSSSHRSRFNGATTKESWKTV